MLKHDEIREYTRRSYSWHNSVISDYIDEACKRIDGVSLYEFDESYYDETEYKRFIHDISRVFNINAHIRTVDEHIQLLSGEAGIGKTMFLKEGIEKIVDDTHLQKAEVYVDFRDVDEQKDISYYEKKIYQSILEQISIISKDNDAMVAYKSDFVPTYLQFITKYCARVNNEYNLPLVIVIDNIDLCHHDTQRSVLRAVRKLNDQFSSFITQREKEYKFRIMLSIRPETNTFFKNELGNADVIDFPHPKVTKIYEMVIRKGLETIIEEEGNVEISFYFDGRTTGKPDLPDLKALANYIIDKTIKRYFSYWDDRTNPGNYDVYNNIDTFHNYIVNFNIRRILNFFAKSLKNGGFRPFRNTNSEDRNYNFYDHLNFLICGSHDFHPGNHMMDGEGFYHRSPIVMNLFDMDPWRNTPDYLKNYFIYVRIVQYIELNGHDGGTSVRGLDLFEHLKCFFEPDAIFTALRRLVFADLIKETELGVRNIAFQNTADDIPINEDTIAGIAFSTDQYDTAKTYFSFLLVEFQYIANMAVTVPMYLDEEDEIVQKHLTEYSSCRRETSRIHKYCSANRERIAYIFLTSMFNVLKENIASYRNDENKFTSFAELFIVENSDSDGIILKPWRRMVDNYIRTINEKIEYGTYSNDKMEELEELRSAGEKLKDRGDQFCTQISNEINRAVMV